MTRSVRPASTQWCVSVGKRSCSFDRFFNFKEDPEDTRLLLERWSDVTFQEKHDGSRNAENLKELALRINADNCPYRSLIFELYRMPNAPQDDFPDEFWLSRVNWFVEHLVSNQ